MALILLCIYMCVWSRCAYALAAMWGSEDNPWGLVETLWISEL